MGYRVFIGEMPKREYNKIKSLTYEQLVEFYKEEKEEDGSWQKSVYKYGKELYSFGKYTEFDPPKKTMTAFFKKKEVMEHYSEHDFFIVTKEFLSYLINYYRGIVGKYYSDMATPFLREEYNLSEFAKSVKNDYNYPNEKITFDFSLITPEEQTAIHKLIEHVRSFKSEWVDLTPFDLEKGEEVTKSWKFEYGIFELVRIYKRFDWKKNVMIYYGY